MTLTQALEKETNYTETENGALTHQSTLSNLLDFFGLGASMRNREDSDVASLFSKAFAEDKLLALKCLFYIRDARSGQGERKTFRTILKWLGENNPEDLKANLEIIPEFGRWDDLFCLEGTSVWNDVLELIKKNWQSCFENSKPSLLAKWLPSPNTSSKEACRLAKVIYRHLKLTEKQYRKTLSKWRQDLKVVEKQMCAKKWNEIEYSHVPSKASLIYKKAFARNDKERYEKFLKDVKEGKQKINASVLYPYDIVKKYIFGEDKNETVEALWNSLPDYLKGKKENGLVVADVSGSMMNPNLLPMSVSISLALYISERTEGLFKNHFITFSEKPTLQKVIGNNLHEKVQNLKYADWGMSTNIQAVFDLILETSLKHNIKQDEMPETLYIVSDMEFNQAVSDNTKTNFQVIDEKYEQYGYKRPNLVFWNVNAKSNQSPITKDDKGTCLVSGCSPVILESLMEKKYISAVDVMMETLNKDRYNVVKTHDS